MVKPLDFMVLGLPRSGTTWAANWLTTEHSICWHDPEAHMLPRDFDRRPSEKRYRGISCTGAWMWLPWVNAHPARKVILVRDPAEVSRSLKEIGLPPVTPEMVSAFERVDGLRIPFEMLWKNPERIWSALMPGVAFDAERHLELAKMSVQPLANVCNLPTAQFMKTAMEDLRRELCDLH